MLDAVSVDDLTLLLELLATGAVESLVLRDVEIVGIKLLDPAQQLGDRASMARLGGADPIVVAALQPPPELLEAASHPIHPLLRPHLGASGSLQDGLAVLVHPH